MLNLINFLKMKYEQFIMRECDRLDICTKKCEDKIFKLGDEKIKLEIENFRLSERIDELEQELYCYDPCEEETEEF